MAWVLLVVNGDVKIRQQRQFRVPLVKDTTKRVLTFRSVGWWLVINLFLSAALLQRLIDDPFQLTIHTSKLIRGPFLQGLERFFVDPQYKVFLTTTHYKWI